MTRRPSDGAARLQAHLRATQSIAGTPIDDALTAARARLLHDEGQVSDVFEPSLAWSTAGLDALRFSYAFPRFRAEADAATAALLSMAAPFGDEARAACARVVRAARQPVVEQPIFGFAAGAAGERARVKMYLQFRPAATRAAGELVTAVTSLPVPASALENGALHMVGLDLGSAGLVSVKMYVLRATVATADHPAPLVRDLAAVGCPTVRQLLDVFRFSGPGALPSGVAPSPADVDLGLRDSELSWDRVRALPCVARHVAASAELAALERDVGVRVRRISAPARSDDRLTLYYVPAA